MAKKQILNFSGYLAAGFMFLMLQACSPSDSAPYYLNNQSTSSQSSESTETQTAAPGPATAAPGPATSAPAPATAATPPPSNSCTVYGGQSYPHGSTIFGYCSSDENGMVTCYTAVGYFTYTCNNGTWVPK